MDRRNQPTFHFRTISAAVLPAVAAFFLCTAATAQEVQVDTPGAEVQVDREANRPREARPTRDRVADRLGQQQDRLDRQIVQWIQTDQQAIVELAQYGLKQTKNPEVQELSELIIKEHQQLVSELQNYPQGEDREATRTDRRRRLDNRRTDRQQDRDDRDGPIEQRLERLGDRIEQGATQLADRAERAIDRRVNTDRELQNRQVAGSPWVEIHQDITDQVTQNVKADLEAYQGTAFDSAFVGVLVAAHVQQEATLNALSKRTSGELAERLEKAAETMRMHRARAKQVMQSVQ